MSSDSPPPNDRPEVEAPYVPPPPYVPMQRQRPFGVTLLAILEILVGIIYLFGALGSFLLAAVIDVQEIIDQLGQEFPMEIVEAIPSFFAIVGIALLIMAILWFVVAYGYLKGRGWAWTLSVVLLVISILFSVVSGILTFSLGGLASMLVGIAIPVIVLVYLFQPKVKAWFGKA